MLYSFPSQDEAFNANMRKWRFQAVVAYFSTIAILLVTPFLAAGAAEGISPGALDTWFVTGTIGSWERIYYYSAIFVILFIEVVGFAFTAISSEVDEIDERVEPLLKELVGKTNLPMPRIVAVKKASILNAAAGRTFFLGRKVILIGDTTELTVSQLRSVLAHELGHLLMRDIRTKHVLVALQLAVRVLNLMILASLLATLSQRNYELTYFLLFAFIITYAGGSTARMLSLWYSRICEYRADGVAVQLTNQDHRYHLMSAVKKVSEIGFSVLLNKRERNEVDWDKTHPSLVKRARALGLKLKDKFGPMLQRT